MSDAWGVFWLGVSLVCAGAAGYSFGHDAGLEDADSAAMQDFMDRCLVEPPPTFCMELLNRTTGYGSFANGTVYA